jgi:hypothetical protein
MIYQQDGPEMRPIMGVDYALLEGNSGTASLGYPRFSVRSGCCCKWPGALLQMYKTK